MNLDFTDAPRITAIGAITSGQSRGTPVTAAGSANTKGSYTQLTASTTYAISGFYLRCFNNEDGNVILDIAVGGAGSEVIILPDFFIWTEQAPSPYIPVSIPAGTRVSARIQATNASQSMDVALYGVAATPRRRYGGWRCFQGGANTAGTNLTGIDPGTTVNTLGSWSQIIASTNHVGKHMIVNAFGFATDTVRSRTLVDIGVGAAGQEQPLVQSLVCTGKDYLSWGINGPIGFDIDIPAGTRISARSQCETAQSPARLGGVQVLIFG